MTIFFDVTPIFLAELIFLKPYFTDYMQDMLKYDRNPVKCH